MWRSVEERLRTEIITGRPHMKLWEVERHIDLQGYLKMTIPTLESMRFRTRKYSYQQFSSWAYKLARIGGSRYHYSMSTIFN
eukprot:4484725-Amphidinium_carterae.1